MKKMKNLKKLMALLLALVMVMGMTTTVMATENTNKNAAKIVGVEKGLIVKAYQIIKLTEQGEYEEIIPGSISKGEDGNLSPKVKDIVALETQIAKLGTPVTFVGQDDGTYTSTELSVGTWMVIVEGSAKYIYNPAIISVMEETDGTKSYGELDFANDKWDTSSEFFLKRNEPTLEKTAKTENVQGVQYGDIIQFEIVADIPSYTANKTNITYVIKDTLTGLSLVVDAEHQATGQVGKGENWSADEILTTAVNKGVINDQKAFVVDLTGQDAFLKANGNQQIKLTYYAKVTSDAKLTVDELNNTATLDYSTYDEVGHKADDTKHYTFGIDTTVTATTGTQHTSGEFIKMNDEGDVEYNETGTDVEFTETLGAALDGAEFKLIYKVDDQDVEFENPEGTKRFTTANGGRLEINGLDSDVQYWLVETNPPTGYTLNDTPIPVKIDATYDKTTGELIEYSVTIGDGENKGVTHYKWENGTATIDPEISNPFGFKNTKLAKLPSTGGIGTTIFTIAGCVIMIAAVGLFFASRKKR